MQKVRIIENFITWQGEGISAGQRMLLLRFKKCNRNCNFGGKGVCDTQVKMRISNEFDFPLKEIQEIINREKCGVLVTGGEPTFDENLEQTISIINKIKAPLYNIETNGCSLEELIKRVNKNKNVKYVLSPKLFNSSDFMGYKRLVEQIKDNSKVYLKLVTENRPEVIQFLDWLVEIKFDVNRIFLMPEGVTHDEILSNAPFVFDMAEKYKTNFSSREHIIYGFV